MPCESTLTTFGELLRYHRQAAGLPMAPSQRNPLPSPGLDRGHGDRVGHCVSSQGPTLPTQRLLEDFRGVGPPSVQFGFDGFTVRNTIPADTTPGSVWMYAN
jgi:hypothetical protein